MQQHINHATHNQDFHNQLVADYPDDYFSWKVTALFYVAYHYMKALAAMREVDIGDSHKEVKYNITPGGWKDNPTMPIEKSKANDYGKMLDKSWDARYLGFLNPAAFNEKMKSDHVDQLAYLKRIRDYMLKLNVPV